jgi:hypothetical protein
LDVDTALLQSQLRARKPLLIAGDQRERIAQLTKQFGQCESDAS